MSEKNEALSFEHLFETDEIFRGLFRKSSPQVQFVVKGLFNLSIDELNKFSANLEETIKSGAATKHSQAA